MRFKSFFLLTLFFVNYYVFSQTQSETLSFNWNLTKGDQKYLYYNNEGSALKRGVKPFYLHVPLKQAESLEVSFTVLKDLKLSSISSNDFFTANTIQSSVEVNTYYRKSGIDKFGIIEIKPYYKKNNEIYLVEELTVNYSKLSVSNSFGAERSGGPYASSSVLSSGDFFKIHTINDGVYQLTYDDLIDQGYISSSVSTNSINIYGNHNGMLPEQNSGFRYDDLQKNAIEVVDGGDNSFDQGDYILFYAESPHKWNYNTSTSLFEYTHHLYVDKSTYFITFNDNSGAKRVTDQPPSGNVPNYTMNTFNDFKVREIESVNLMAANNRGGSGKRWFGEVFDVQLNYPYSFAFPNVDATSNVNVKTVVAAYTPGAESSSFTITAEGNSSNIIIAGIPVGSHADIAREGISNLAYTGSSGNVSVNVQFTKALSGNSQGWLDYIEVNAKRNMVMNGDQLIFQDADGVGVGNVSSFTLTNASQVSQIWEITDPLSISRLVTTDLGSDKSFVFDSDTLRKFIAFKATGYQSVEFGEQVENQNLHGQTSPDMMIVYHPNFEAQVDKLKAFHESKGLTVQKASVFEIYNEFSSGMQDVTAIKTYAKMHYDRANPSLPKYMLLFGDGSYDYKGRVSPNHNFVPVWESADWIDDLASHTTDDFYGILDDNEGISVVDLLDVAVGRLTVRSATEAEIVVNKIISYQSVSSSPSEIDNCNSSASQNSFGDWRNVLTFVTDDVDENWEMSFFRHVEKVSDSIEKNYPVFNVEKLHMDAFKQESTPGGERYFNGAEAIKRRVENGSLIVAYEGHGGEVGWAHERILDLATINGWTNYYRLPVFLTATCEFTKFDDPSRTSAGEQLFLNPNGGSIALFTTTRAVFQSSNERLIEAFFKESFVKESGGKPRTLGDIYKLTKNNPSVIGSYEFRKFSLIGDPALDLAFPKHQVITDSVNGVSVNSTIDTLKALSKVTLSGFVADQSGNIISNYNGFVFPTVFDKEQTLNTLGNKSPTYIAGFDVQKSILYKGKATVKNGRFEFSFVVPKDINYSYGAGKISYYAFNGTEDATGYSNDVTIGGTNPNGSQDNVGPEVNLYLNNESFVSGGITDEDPTLYASLFDSNGINTTGNGIGHDLTAVIDENTSQAIVLNNYYESDPDSYQSGKVVFPMDRLSEGNHTLSLKAWDVYNNSSETTIDFVVVKNEKLAIDHVLNYPNPFTTRTQFFFEHNQNCESLEVQIQVFTVSGKLVKTINQAVLTNGYRVEPIEWDGKDDYGDRIGRGTYVYRVKVTDNENNKVEKFEKLVLLK